MKVTDQKSGGKPYDSYGYIASVVSKLLNHSEASSVTSIYDRHSYDAEKRNALESWGEKLKAILSDKELANNVVWLKNTG